MKDNLLLPPDVAAASGRLGFAIRCSSIVAVAVALAVVPGSWLSVKA